MENTELDISDTISDMAQETDPNQIAVLLDNELATIGYRVVHGYNEQTGYYLIK